MLIVNNEDDRVFPEGPVADGVHDLGDMILSALDVGGRMLVVFEGVPFDAEIWIYERHLGQGTNPARFQQE